MLPPGKQGIRRIIYYIGVGLSRCSFRQVGQCESLYSVERATEYSSHAFFIVNLFRRGAGEIVIECMESVYIEYLDTHPNMRCRKGWIDRQYDSNGRISEYIAYFYILRYNEKYIGVVESGRPNSATYIYGFPNKNIELYSYVYEQHFAEPYISREPDAYYIDRIQKINQLLKMKADKEVDDPDLDEIDEELHNLTGVFVPIKCRDYFLGEVAHTNIEKWTTNLENIIAQYILGTYNKKPLDNIQCDDASIEETGRMCEHLYDYDLAQCMQSEIEDNYKKTLNINAGKSKNKNSRKKSNKEIVKNTDYDLTSLFGKSIREIASVFRISPYKLLSMIQQRISSIHVDSIKSKLDANQISLCQRIFEELWSINQKNNESK